MSAHVEEDGGPTSEAVPGATNNDACAADGMGAALKSILRKVLGADLGTAPDRPEGFSSPPPIASSTRAGTLLRSVPVHLPPGVPAGSEALRILYSSLDDLGRPVPVTGLAYLPPGPAPREGRMVVTYGHGAVGVSDGCAPSRFPVHPPLVSEFLARNMVVVASDYEGLGTPTPHRYLAGRPAARSMLDAVRAAAALPDSSTCAQVLCYGVSAGGHAALWAAEQNVPYAPDLDVIGTIAVAPVGNLVSAMRRYSADARFSHYAVMLAWTWRDWTPELQAAPVFPPAAQKWLPELDRRCPGTFAKVLPASLDAQLLREWFAIPVWERALIDNTPGQSPIDHPLLVVAAAHDDPVPPESVDELLRALSIRRNEVTRVDVDADHHTVADAARAHIRGWLDEVIGPPERH